MLIDWFTVIAQALNFLILVWLLKRFLYKPILHAVEAREKRIADELRDADAKKAEAQRERDQFQRKNEDFAQQRDGLLRKAEEEAKTERQRLLAQARKDAETLRNKFKQALENERASLNHTIAARIQQEVLALTRKTLADLAGENLEARITDVFVRHLHDLNGEEENKLRSLLQQSHQTPHVRSAFDLPPPQRAAIQRTLNEKFGTPIQIEFETSPGLVSGIELAIDGHKIAWSIPEYLTSLEKSLDTLTPGKDDKQS